MSNKFLTRIALPALAALGSMAVLSAIAYPIAFGSGDLLRRWTGHNFRTVDAVVTAVVGPLLWLVTLVLSYWPPPAWAAWRFRQAMRTRGRYRRWSRLLPDLQRGRGTLLVEVIEVDPVGVRLRTWWTPDEVIPPPAPWANPTAVAGHSAVLDDCRSRYLDARTGTALLTDGTAAIPGLPDLPTVTAPLRQQFPALALVALPLLSRPT